MLNWFKKFSKRPFVVKFHYGNRSRADDAFNMLMSFFVKHRAEYRVFKSKICDSSPYDSEYFEWCVYFKFVDIERPAADHAGEKRDISDFIEEARKTGRL